MPRRTRRRSSAIEKLLLRAILILAVAAVVLIAVSILVTDYPRLAAVIFFGVPLGGTAIAIGIWQRRRRARANEARMRLLQAQRIGELLTVSATEFEEIVAELFRARGYKGVRRVGGSGDLGVDLTCRDPTGRAVIVQCKRYGPGNRVGSPAIQSFMGMVVHHRAAGGYFVTTSDFTGPAITTARSAPMRITLIDGEALTRLAIEAETGGLGADRECVETESVDETGEHTATSLWR